LVHIVISSLLGGDDHSTYNKQITDSGVLFFQLHLVPRLRFDYGLDGVLDPGETFFRSHGFILPFEGCKGPAHSNKRPLWSTS